MKKHLFNLLLFTVLVIGLSGCRTSAPKLDYKKLARASVRLGVDIGMEAVSYTHLTLPTILRV